MTPRPRPAAIDPALLGEIVAVAFSQRRKLLRHTLGRWLEARGRRGGIRSSSAGPRRCRSRNTSAWRRRVAGEAADGRSKAATGATRGLSKRQAGTPPSSQAALSHMAVSNALLISGMFAPKLLFAAVFATFTGLSPLPLPLPC